jgi:hypothetical protein
MGLRSAPPPSVAAAYTLIETAKLNGLDPEAYLTGSPMAVRSTSNSRPIRCSATPYG